MRTKRTSIRQRQALALAGVTLIVAAVARICRPGWRIAKLAGDQVRSRPRMAEDAHPSDSVAGSTTPGFHSSRAANGTTEASTRTAVQGQHAGQGQDQEDRGRADTVVHDVVRRHGKPREVTNDWYVQDRHGNVWYFGENTKELDRHGHVTSRDGSFKAGRNGARPGVLFPGHPRVDRRPVRSTTRATPRTPSRSSTSTRASRRRTSPLTTRCRPTSGRPSSPRCSTTSGTCAAWATSRRKRSRGRRRSSISSPSIAADSQIACTALGAVQAPRRSRL